MDTVYANNCLFQHHSSLKKFNHYYFSFFKVSLLNTWFFYSSFRITAKLRGRYRDFPYTKCPHLCIVSSIINIPHQSGAFVTTDEPTLTHHYHPKSIVYIRVHSCCTFYAFGQMYNIMTCIHHYSIIQNSFTPLIVLCASPIHLSLILTPATPLFLKRGIELVNQGELFPYRHKNENWFSPKDTFISELRKWGQNGKMQSVLPKFLFFFLKIHFPLDWYLSRPHHALVLFTCCLFSYFLFSRVISFFVSSLKKMSKNHQDNPIITS